MEHTISLICVFPKWAAIISFWAAYHITANELLCNGSLDASVIFPTLSMFVLCVSSSNSFYQLAKANSLSQKNPRYHWPVFLFTLLVSFYYTSAGMNKLVDVGLLWPIHLHLDQLARSGTEQALFLFNGYADPWICSLFLNPKLSLVLGIVAFITEIGFVSVLFFLVSNIFSCPLLATCI